MKTISTTVYTFDELTPAAQSKARDWFRADKEFDGQDHVIEDAKQCLAFAGFNVENVHYTGFSSQGDGACFTGAWSAADVEPGKTKEHAPKDETLHAIAAEVERIAALFPHASLKVEHSGGHYCHEFCTEFTVSIADESGDEIDSIARFWRENDLINVSRRAMKWIYRQLESSYEWENADEQVDESIRANEYTFTADGKRFG